jgi:hypothetical protein
MIEKLKTASMWRAVSSVQGPSYALGSNDAARGEQIDMVVRIRLPGVTRVNVCRSRIQLCWIAATILRTSPWNMKRPRQMSRLTGHTAFLRVEETPDGHMECTGAKEARNRRHGCSFRPCACSLSHYSSCSASVISTIENVTSLSSARRT